MATSYDGDPGNNEVDEIRFLVNDKASPWLMTNEEITYLLTLNPKVAGVANYQCAIAAALQIAAGFANKVDKSVGSLSIRYGDQNRKYLELADRYKSIARSGLTGQAPLAGGVPELFGGGETYLGPDNSPNYYSE